MATTFDTDSLVQDLLEAALDAMVVVDEERRIRVANAHVERLSGYARDEVIGHSLDLIVSPPVPPEGGAQLARRRDGAQLPVEVSVRRLARPDGLHAIVTIRDLTERQQRAQELRRARASGGEVVANMSHELRTPLNAIIGFSELMYKGKAGPLADIHREYLGDVLASARRLLQLVNDVVDLAKVEAGRMPLHLEQVDLAELVSSMRELVRGLAAARAVRLHVEVSPELRVVADVARTKHILFHLVASALARSPDRGQLHVRAHARDAGAVWVEVEDEGTGSDGMDRVSLVELVDGLAREQGGEVRVVTGDRGRTATLVVPRLVAEERT